MTVQALSLYTFDNIAAGSKIIKTPNRYALIKIQLNLYNTLVPEVFLDFSPLEMREPRSGDRSIFNTILRVAIFNTILYNTILYYFECKGKEASDRQHAMRCLSIPM